MESSPFEVRYSEEKGRFLVATRNIGVGEIIHTELPTIYGPTLERFPLKCVVCCEKSEEIAKSRCALCGLAVCERKCCQAKHSETGTYTNGECQLISQTKRPVDIQKLIPLIPIIRLLILLYPTESGLDLNVNAEERERVGSLLTHYEERIRTWRKAFVDQWVIGPLRMLEGAKWTDEQIQKACGLLDSNTFDVSSSLLSIKGRALYPKAAMINSSCAPNTTHHFRFQDGDRTQPEVVVRAAKDIPEGEEVTTCYVKTRSNREVRLAQLQKTKFFTCTCDRCEDDTDQGRFTEALRCPNCPGFLLERSERWTCNSCHKTIPNDQISAVQKMCSKILAKVLSAEKESSFGKHLLKAIAVLSKFLSPNHYLLTELKVRFISGLDIAGASINELFTAMAFCRETTDLLLSIEGKSRSFGFLKLDQAKIMNEIVKRQAQSKEFQADVERCRTFAFDLLQTDIDADLSLI